MSRSERDKGRRAENELVGKLRFYGIAAERVSEAGSPGPDVTAFGGRTIEVKRRAKLPVTLEKWRRDAQIVAMREDLGHWMLYLPLEEFLDIIDEAKDTFVDTFLDIMDEGINDVPKISGRRRTWWRNVRIDEAVDGDL